MNNEKEKQQIRDYINKEIEEMKLILDEYLAYSENCNNKEKLKKLSKQINAIWGKFPFGYTEKYGIANSLKKGFVRNG